MLLFFVTMFAILVLVLFICANDIHKEHKEIKRKLKD